MRLPDTASIRIPALIVLAAGEIWGILHFWGTSSLFQFFIGSASLGLIAAYVLHKRWFEARNVRFGEYGWLVFSLFSALDADNNHERGLEIFWLALLALFAVQLRPKIMDRSQPPSLTNAASSRMPYIISGLIYVSALAWLRQFLPYRLPSWASITLLIPALLLMVRAFLPDRWFERELGTAS